MQSASAPNPQGVFPFRYSLVHGGDGGIAVQRASYGLGLIADKILVGVIAAFHGLVIVCVVVSHDPGAAYHLQKAPPSTRLGAGIPGVVIAAVADADAVIEQIIGDEGVVCAGNINVYAIFILIKYIAHYQVIAGRDPYSGMSAAAVPRAGYIEALKGGVSCRNSDDASRSARIHQRTAVAAIHTDKVERLVYVHILLIHPALHPDGVAGHRAVYSRLDLRIILARLPHKYLGGTCTSQQQDRDQ